MLRVSISALGPATTPSLFTVLEVSKYLVFRASSCYPRIEFYQETVKLSTTLHSGRGPEPMPSTYRSKNLGTLSREPLAVIAGLGHDKQYTMRLCRSV